MHLATIYLATAMQHNRIFLWAPNTNRTPILEERKWWRPFIAAHLQHFNEIVRTCRWGELLDVRQVHSHECACTSQTCSGLEAIPPMPQSKAHT